MTIGNPFKFRALRLSFTLVAAAASLFARDSTDIVIMKNDDWLTGQVKGLDAGVLYVSMTYMLSTSSIDWSNVANSVQRDNQDRGRRGRQTGKD